MSADPTAAVRVRLGKLLILLGSGHTGERDAAGSAVRGLLQQRGVTWRQAPRPPPVERDLPELGTWRQSAAACLQRQGPLRHRNTTFLPSLPGFRSWSVKQGYCDKTITDRVLEHVE
jgi:hypothetical protein